MDTYIEVLFVFLLLFALGSTLAYLPGILKIKDILKRDLLFLTALGSVYLLDNSLKYSNIAALGVIFLSFNIYSWLIDKRRSGFKMGYLLIDFVYGTLTLLVSFLIIAMVDDLPIKKVIIERFEDGSYSFTPGYLEEMVTTSIIFSLLITNYRHFYSYLLGKWVQRQNHKIEQLQSQKRNIETQFEALQAKVNPHFLYNSLNSIAGLATIDGEKTRKMALALSRFFRYSINRDQEVMTTLKDEAEMVNTYLEIEKIRFETLLRYTIDLPEAIESFKIPRMLLQPIVENCIKHGMRGDIDILKIQITFLRVDNTLVLSVKDNGAPFPDDFIPGYGIQSVYEKLNLLYPDNYKIELVTEPEKDFRIYIESI